MKTYTKTQIESKIQAMNRIEVRGNHRICVAYRNFLITQRCYWAGILNHMDETNINSITL